MRKIKRVQGTPLDARRRNRGRTSFPEIEDTTQPPKKKIGAPFGNRNAKTIHGMKSFENGRWPRGTSFVPRLTKMIGDGLRQELVRKHGATTPLTEALISSALTHESRALLLERLYRRNRKTLKHLEIVTILESIGNARNNRDKCLIKMGLGIKPTDADVNLWPGMPRLLDESDEPEIDDDAEAG